MLEINQSHQEIFNTVATHLLEQGRKSTIRKDGNTLCRYRDDKGRKCAIGVLISDEAYTPKMETVYVRGLRNHDFISCDKQTLDLLTSLQQIHDTFRPNRWKAKLHALAAAHGLEPLP